jgi:hypothetical protein
MTWLNFTGVFILGGLFGMFFMSLLAFSKEPMCAQDRKEPRESDIAPLEGIRLYSDPGPVHDFSETRPM